MNNNEVLKKLRVALQLRDDQIVDILKLADFNMDKSELNAFFRIGALFLLMIGYFKH